jgi:AcrR family transcriptional regulator
MKTRSAKPSAPSPRTPLSRARVIEAGVALADQDGIEALSMRKLAATVGVEAMSLYNHVANKDELLDGMVERVMGQVYVAAEDGAWQTELRRRALSLHEMLLRHPWAATLIESRWSGPDQLVSSNALLGCMRRAGFSVGLAFRALMTLDSYLYGFVFQEVTWPHRSSELPQVIDDRLPEVPAAELPHLVEMMRHVADSAPRRSAETHREYRAELEFGLDLVLYGLERALRHERSELSNALRSRRAAPRKVKGPRK